MALAYGIGHRTSLSDVDMSIDGDFKIERMRRGASWLR